VELGVAGEAAVYCDRAWRALRVATRDGAWPVLRRCGVERSGEQEGGSDAQRSRAALAQCAVSERAPRVSTSVYDGSA
jgi:hypothetical protein